MMNLWAHLLISNANWNFKCRMDLQTLLHLYLKIGCAFVNVITSNWMKLEHQYSLRMTVNYNGVLWISLMQYRR